MTFAIEVDSRVSEELSEFIESLANNSDIEVPHARLCARHLARGRGAASASQASSTGP